MRYFLQNLCANVGWKPKLHYLRHINFSRKYNGCIC